MTRPRATTNAQLLAALRVLAARLHRVPTTTDWDRFVPAPSYPTVIARFGSWAGALDLAGLGTPRDLTPDEARLCAGLAAVVERGQAPQQRHEED